MNLEKLNKRANLNGFIFLYAAITAFLLCIVDGIILFGGNFPKIETPIVSVFLTMLVFTIFLFYLATKFWPFGDEEMTVLYKDIIYLSEIINGSPCEVTNINLIKKKGVTKRRDLYFSFKKQTICIKGIDFVKSSHLVKGSIFSIMSIPSKDGKKIDIKIEKIV